MMGMHTLPLAGFDQEALHDDPVVFEQVLAGDVWIVEVLIFGTRARHGGVSHRFECYRDPFDGRRARVGASPLGMVGHTLPGDPAILPERSPSRSFRSKQPALDEHEQLVTLGWVAPGRLTWLKDESLNRDPRVIEHRLAFEVRVCLEI